ncbi:DUF6551 family protein [Nitratireductor soli]|uniref:DUF6551 family protein n=1 Tax=Nitratireductor soli TaxID=1670619 RepID=UPI00065E3338|nr:DUF6551 family protein [Nitratireductor soli]
MNEINRAIGDKPALEWVSVETIDVDSNYQREIKPALVNKILRGFSWTRFGAIVLSRQESGRFSIVEGQHRWKAASLHPDVDQVPAVIVSHADVAGEARSFLAINRDRMAVTSVEQYWAGLTAGDDNAIQISKVLQSAGCDVVPAQGHYRPNLTNSIGAVDRCLKRYGDTATRRALLIIRAAWPNEAKALRGVLITALARIIRTNQNTVNDPELAAAIRRESFAELTAHAEAFRKLSGGSTDTALAKTIAELYNKGRRVKTIYFGEAR